jgi:hypothetical protein
MPARMPRTSRTPRRHTVSCVAPRSVGRRRPVAPLSVRRSLGGSRFAYKGAAALASVRQAPSHRPEPPPAPVDAATTSIGSGRPKSPASAPTVSPCPHYSSPARFLSPRAAPRRELAAAAAITADRRCARPSGDSSPQPSPKFKP